MDVFIRLVVCVGCVFSLSLLTENLTQEESLRSSDARPRTSQGVCSPQASTPALLARSDIQTELGITDSQHHELNEALASCKNDLSAFLFFVGSVDQRRLTHRSMEKWSNDALACERAVIENFEAQLLHILRAEQLGRLKNLQLQREGLLAFRRPDVVQALGLTKSQQLIIDELPACGFYSAAPNEQRSRAAAALVEVFTESQYSEWMKLRGTDYPFVNSPDAISFVHLGL